MNKILAWHFLREDCKMRFNHGITIKPGVEYEAKLPLIMCKNGLHASEQIIDALCCAPGPVVCRVELSGRMIKNNDKICAEKRKVLWMYDVTNVLHEFALTIAEQALLKERESGREPDPRSWQAIKVKRQWLEGESSLKELKAAKKAAGEVVREVAIEVEKRIALGAARNFVWKSKWETARAVSEAVSWAAPWEIAWETARAVLWAASWATPWAALRKIACKTETVTPKAKLNSLLEQMIICESAKRSLWKTGKE